MDPSGHHQETQAGFPELPPCPPVSRRRPASEVSSAPPLQCCRICGSAGVEKAARSPCSGRIVSHGQYITVTVKRRTIDGSSPRVAPTAVNVAGFCIAMSTTFAPVNPTASGIRLSQPSTPALSLAPNECDLRCLRIVRPLTFPLDSPRTEVDPVKAFSASFSAPPRLRVKK